MHMKVTTYVLLGSKSHGRPVDIEPQRWERPGWRANLEAGTIGMTTAAKWGPAVKSLSGPKRKPTRSVLSGKADVAGEEAGKAPCGSAAVQVLASREGHAEITSGVAASKAISPADGSSVMQIARFMHVAIPQFVPVTVRPLRGVNGPAALRLFFGSVVGAIGGPSECGSLNIKE
jgi:hypothetical protein